MSEIARENSEIRMINRNKDRFCRDAIDRFCGEANFNGYEFLCEAEFKRDNCCYVLSIVFRICEAEI